MCVFVMQRAVSAHGQDASLQKQVTCNSASAHRVLQSGYTKDIPPESFPYLVGMRVEVIQLCTCDTNARDYSSVLHLGTVTNNGRRPKELNVDELSVDSSNDQACAFDGPETVCTSSRGKVLVGTSRERWVIGAMHSRPFGFGRFCFAWVLWLNRLLEQLRYKHPGNSALTIVAAAVFFQGLLRKPRHRKLLRRSEKDIKELSCIAEGMKPRKRGRLGIPLPPFRLCATRLV